MLADGVQVITSSQDLIQIQPTDGTLKIQSLKDNGLAQDEERSWNNIRKIEILGPVATVWIRQLALKFPQVTNLTIDVDAICKEAAGAQGIIIEFPKVEHLGITNLRKCEGVARFKLVFPSLKTVEVTDSKLETKRFGFIHDLLKTYKEQLEIVIVAAELCNECSVFDIDFPRRTKVKTSKS